MLKYIVGMITGTALTIIGWQKVIVAIIMLIKSVLMEIGL